MDTKDTPETTHRPATQEYVKIKFISSQFRARNLPAFPYVATRLDATGIRYAAILPDNENAIDMVMLHFPDALVDVVEHQSPYDFTFVERALGYPIMGTVRAPEQVSWFRRFWSAMKV